MKKKFETFLTEKGITSEEFGKKSADEQSELWADFIEVQIKAQTELVEKKASKEEIAELIREKDEARAEEMKVIKAAMKEQGEAMKSMSASHPSDVGRPVVPCPFARIEPTWSSTSVCGAIYLLSSGHSPGKQWYDSERRTGWRE